MFAPSHAVAQRKGYICMGTRKRKKVRHRLNRRRGILLGLIAALLVGGLGYWKFARTAGPSSDQLAYGGGVYTVEPGDSLNAIAARYGVSAGAIMSANGLTNPNLVVIGARLRIPAASGLPNDAQGVEQLVSSYAQTYGIPPAFALATAWQESGFNQNMVSRTGAIGVMQVEPDTGVTIANLLGRPFDLHILRDNVQAGVYWLARLDSLYGGDQRLAAAAYYQGARSVSRDGLYSDTTRYVDNVMALEARFGG